MLPEEKKASFTKIRDDILVKQVVGVKTLQRIQGKCIAFSLVVPAARLYISEMSSAINVYTEGTMLRPLVCRAHVGQLSHNGKTVPDGPFPRATCVYLF